MWRGQACGVVVGHSVERCGTRGPLAARHGQRRLAGDRHWRAAALSGTTWPGYDGPQPAYDGAGQCADWPGLQSAGQSIWPGDFVTADRGARSVAALEDFEAAHGR